MVYGRVGMRLRIWLRSLRPLTGIFAALLLVAMGCRVASNPTAAPPSQPARGANSLLANQSRQRAPDLSLTDISGNTLTLSQFRGKVVLLDFWAVDCGGCVIEIPWYVEFDKKYRARGLQLIGIDMYGESPAYIRPFMQKSGMQYPVAVGNDDIRKRFQADELPKTMLIDREGRVAVSHVGIVNKAAFEHDIEELLK